MPFEDAKYIDELVDTDPVPNDPVNQGDDQLRQIKLALQANVLGNVDGTQLNVANLPALDIAQPTPEFPVMTLGALSQAAKVKLGNVEGDDVVQLDNAIAAAGIQLRGQAVVIFEGVETGAAAMYFTGEVAIITTANGVKVGQPGVVGRVAVEDNNDVEAVTLDAAAGGVSLNALVEDVTLALNGTPTGGGGVPLVTGDPNGEAALYNAGESAVRTISNGIEVGVPTVAGRINVLDSNGAVAASIRGLATAAEFRSVILDNVVRLIASGGSGNVTVVEGDPNGAAQLNWIGSERIRTADGGAVITGNCSLTAALPTSNNEATRKDYVDTRSRSNSSDRRIEVQNRMSLDGTVTATGQTWSITFATAFTSVPAMTMSVLNPTQANNAFASIEAISITGANGFVGFANATIMWVAQGTNARGL